MKIIAIANRKGGVGKSTIATNFAVLSAQAGTSVVLVDADPQASSLNFRNIRPEDRPVFRAVGITTPTIHKDVAHLGAEHIFIDTGGRDSKAFRSSILASEVVVVPITPGQFDAWSTEQTLSLIAECQVLNPVKVFIVINNFKTGTIIGKDIMQAIKELADEYQAQLLHSILVSRVAYGQASTEGLSVCELHTRGAKKAAEEMKSLYQEVMSYGH